MWAYNPLEWGERLQGTGLSGTSTAYHSRPGDYERWATVFEKSPTAATMLSYTESAMDFFTHESDLGLLIPKREWTEAFFSMRNGFTCPAVPAQFIYFAKKIFELYKIGNLIGPCLPKELSFYLNYEDYITGGFTGVNAIKAFVFEDFQPVTPDRPIVRCGDWYEAYLPVFGMVTALPISVGERLSREDLEQVTLREGVLSIHGKPLASVGGLRGVCNSLYDLRRAI